MRFWTCTRGERSSTCTRGGGPRRRRCTSATSSPSCSPNQQSTLDQSMIVKVAIRSPLDGPSESHGPRDGIKWRMCCIVFTMKASVEYFI
uniref:Pco072468 n=1 Tax=Arundo donax TaxID=35708 RepID=A0A0A9EW98_ARUDO